MGLMVVSCYEREVPPDRVASERSACMQTVDAGTATTTGVFSESPCDRTGAVGGCQAPPLQATFWYYSVNESLIRMICDGYGGTYLTP